MRPGGIVLSPGPGNPINLPYAVETIRGLIGKKPIMGVCLGHQLLAWALGGRTFKLKFGHRGANHPVKDLESGRVYITSQNHGYAVDPDSLKGSAAVVTQINLNDGTVEGLRHTELPVWSIQYHPEASPGPLDNGYLFEKFVQQIKAG
jgi:carbamoyl-phosphate synthase small subunit